MIACIPEAQVESIARVLGECGTGSEITRVLLDRQLVDGSGESTKWKRLYWVFLDSQKTYNCANRMLDFIQAFLAPSRFVGRQEVFEERRNELNEVLAFSGLELRTDGQFVRQKTAKTLDEAERRVRTIRGKFRGRQIHPEVLKYCKSELMRDDYFHAIFEATKGLAQRIREMANCQGDGAALVDRVFSIDRPILAFNALQTDTEKSEHKGFATLLKGCFLAARNPRAHEPRILYRSEDDVADYLSLISMLHRKLDVCVLTRMAGRT